MIELIIDKLEWVLDFNNENLTIKQKDKIFESLQLLKAMKNKETFESLYKEKTDD